jgi:tetratricopeptide (TPR) repeat protein
MSNDPQSNRSKPQPTAAGGSRPAPIKVSGSDKAPPPGPVPNLFRRWDWIAFWVTTAVVFLGYLYTLAPDVTLEDSGELAVASHYAGVPHPPGYPVWTIYTWLFTVLIPFSNIAWRVGLSSAVAGAFSCGLVALLVSRGGSMLMEGIQEFKNVEDRWQRWINLVAGFAAGVMMGFNGFMWSQAVIVEVYTFSVLSFVGVLCYLLRWIYAPHQRRYLYYAAFLFGICLNNHQTLIVATMGIQILIVAVAPRLGRDLLIVNSVVYFIGLILKAKGGMSSFEGNPVLFGIYNAVGIASTAGAAYLISKTRTFMTEWRPVLVLGAGFVIGLAFYFYMPIASMTNPPLNWGYPRTEAGFWHAITRGQYDKTNPSNPFSGRFVEQVIMYVVAAIEEFNFINLMIGLLPFVFYKRMLKRDRAWLVGLGAIYVFLAFLLLILLNPGVDRQSREQSRVFFAASHTVVAIGIGYGMALIGALLATQYERIRAYFLWAAAVAAAVALYGLLGLKTQFPIDKFNAIFLLVLTLVAVGAFAFFRTRAPLGLVLMLFALMPLNIVLGHWADNEQRGHLFGYWFGHDMFTPPFDVYPEMEKNTILFGGTDPGRFNPTYMIFSESFLPPSKKRDPKFDRRDVYLITQNALADGTYLDYIRAHYNRSAQQDPFFFVNFLRSEKEELRGTTNLLARMFLPVDKLFTKIGARIEKKRRYNGVYPPIEPRPEPPPGAADDPYDVGAYYSKEIITPTPEDSQRAFAEYIEDAQRRLRHDMANPNAPRQIKPGEDVRIVDNRISVSGQVAVMAINGLLTKVIFDKNPTNEFYVEESFPLDWMFPHLTPYGIIMKINRQPVPEFTDEILAKDHEFWSKYSDRLVGNWITYETTTQEICEFAERVYLRRDFKGFKGSPEFVRDDNAQKAFSKLRSAIGGVYWFRVGRPANTAEYNRCLKEAEFAFKQAFAYCPYSPEAVYKYVTLLVNVGRAKEADLVVRTCMQFDPDNPAMSALAQNISDILKAQGSAAAPAAPMANPQLANAEAFYRTNPGNLTNAFALASMYLQLQRSNEAIQVLNKLLDDTNASSQSVLSVANAFQQLNHREGLERAFLRATEVIPDSPETWYDLARVQATQQKNAQALASLKRAVDLSNARLKQDPAAFDVAHDALTNANLALLRTNAEFLRLLSK